MEIPFDLKNQIEASELVKQLIANATLEWDNSTFTTWQACFVRGLFFTGLKRVSASQQAPLRFGSAVHEGIADRLRGNSDEHAFATALKVADENGLDECLDPRRNRKTLISLLNAYFLHCDMNDCWIKPVVYNGTPIVEQGFIFPLGTVALTGLSYFKDGNYSIKWKGKLDVLERYQGELWVNDHKTTTVMGEKFIDDKIRSSQMLGYTWAGRQIAFSFNEPLRGVRINALAMRSTGFEFKSFSIPYADLVISAWQAETLQACANQIRLLDAFLASGAVNDNILVVPNRECCVTKYGRCSYFDACEVYPRMLRNYIMDDTLFTDNKWDPLNE